MYNTCEIDLDIHLFDSNLEREIMEMTCEELSSLEHFVRNELNKKLYLAKRYRPKIKTMAEIRGGYYDYR